MALPVEHNVRFQPLLLVLGVARLAGIIGGGLLLLIALLVLPFKLKSVYDYHFGFDRQEWQEARAAGGNPRTHMLADVLAHHLRPGLTRAQVLAELGPADSEFPAALSTTLYYYVGSDYFFPLILSIELGSDGRVQRFNTSAD